MKKRRRSPRILILMENHIYPNDVRVQPHAEALASNGYEVTVISPGGAGYPASDMLNGVKVFRFPILIAGKSAFSYLAEFSIAAFYLTFMTLWIWVRYGLDLLLLYNPPDILWISGLLAKVFGKTILLDIRDHAPELYQAKFAHRNRWIYRFLLWMEYGLRQIADHIMVTNETSRKLVISRDRVPPNKVTVVRQGPDTQRVYPVSPDPDLRARARTIIAYLGNMAQERGVGNLLKALPYLDDVYAYRDWICVLIGRPHPSIDIQGLAIRLGINDRLVCTGFLSQAQWVKLISTADICVDPGSADPANDICTTNKMMDYMALGKPVVAFDLPERRGTAGDLALYAKAGDLADLARQIHRLIESPELCQKLGQAGFELVEKKLAWQYQRQRLLDLFSQITHWQQPTVQHLAEL